VTSLAVEPEGAFAEAGAPFTLEHFRAWASEVVLDNFERWELEPFQESFLEDVFAGTPECWLIVPEGNGKTTLMAGLALYHSEFLATASVPVAASSREQAEIMYRQAEGMVLRTPRLRSVFKCQEGYRRIKNLVNGSRMQVFAADDRTGDGLIPTLALIDELHRHRDLRLYRVWRGKLPKRGGQIATISTAGEPGGEFEVTRERIRQAGLVERDGCFTRARGGGVVLHEWAVPEAGDVEDVRLVKAANPFSGVTEQLLAEKRASPTMTLEHWRRFVCNLPTRSGAAAITEAEWAAAATEERIPAGEPRWAGLDVGWKWDTTALVPLWVRDAEFRLLGPARIVEPPRDGGSTHPDDVKRILLEEHSEGPIHTLVMDTSRAEDIAAWAGDELGCVVVDRQQTAALAALDYERFMEALRQGWLRHSGDEGLKQHALNAVVRTIPSGQARFERPQENRRVGDELARRRVIDALTAAAMVHAAAAASLVDAGVWASAW
jgi:phage terminase large subunit-like protein